MEIEKNQNALSSTKDTSCTDITNLSPNKQRFIHLYCTGQYTNQKLAELLNVHVNTITNWLRDREVNQIIHELQLDTHEMVSMQMNSLTRKAVNRLNQLVDSPIEGVAMQAVKDVLDRGGHKAKQEIKIDKTVTTVEQKLAKLMNETLNDDVIEGEYSEVDDDL